VKFGLKRGVDLLRQCARSIESVVGIERNGFGIAGPLVWQTSFSGEIADPRFGSTAAVLRVALLPLCQPIGRMQPHGKT